MAGVAGPPIAACGAGSNTVVATPGLMVRISTNAPRLVHMVALEIYQNDKRVFRNVVRVGPGEGEVTLPAKLAVEPGSNPHGTVVIVGYVGDEARNILGKTVAETTIPDDRFAVLDMSVDVICIQTHETEGTIGVDETDAHSRCPQGQTCKEGQCASAKVDSKGLAPFGEDDSGTVSMSSGCFDTAACLGAPAAYTVEVNTGSCTFAAQDASDLNVGIRASGGVLTRLGSVAVLDRGTGWTVRSPGVMDLGAGICAEMRAGRITPTVIVSSGVPNCMSKVPGVAVCSGPPGPVDTEEDAGRDVGTGVVDSTVSDVTDATRIDTGIETPGADASESGADTGVDSPVDTGIDSPIDSGADSATCTCAAPPECHKTPGTCNGATCTYPFAQSGAACTDGSCDGNGNCVNACAGVNCNAPPTCRTATGATCSGGVCSYPTTTTDARCVGVCGGGVCSDPCSGVTCSAPATCHTETGATCSGGTCTYPNLPNGYSCPSGTCQSGTCSNPCAGITCNTPNNPCKLNTGTCAAGACSYPNAGGGTSCPGGTCDGNGTCVADPCSGVTCNSPPNICKTAPGTCAAGLCNYGNASSSTACSGGMCNGSGTCVADPCSGITCSSPPNVCKTAPGTCAAGICTYGNASSSTPCSGGNCDGNGSCMTDPCFGIVCNSPPSCKASPGVCSAGICNYGNAAANGTSCQGGSGTCQGGTCMGICSPNPCTNTTECYTNPGTCMPMPDAGLTCTYNPKSYGAQCSIGYCNGNGTCMDACNPNPCNMPPGDCNVMQGTCTLGGDGGPSCAYPFKSNGATCSMGFCNGTGTCVNPCMPNPCNSPPGQCFMGPGMCTAGDGGALCSYFPKPNMTPCTGGACDNNGVCIPMDAGTQ